MPETEDTIDFFSQLKKNWSVVMVVGGIIFSWAYFQFQVSNLTDRVAAVELKAAAIDSISGDIKGINAKLDIILKKIEL